MRIAITGGAGCLGSNLVEHFLAGGHQILVIDNFATSGPEVVPADIPGLTVVEGSIADAHTRRCLTALVFGELHHTQNAHDHGAVEAEFLDLSTE